MRRRVEAAGGFEGNRSPPHLEETEGNADMATLIGILVLVNLVGVLWAEVRGL